MTEGVELCQVVGALDNCLVQCIATQATGWLNSAPSTGQMKSLVAISKCSYHTLPAE